MKAHDQAERMGGTPPPGLPDVPRTDQGRTERLKQLIAGHGWPTRRSVGTDGATAAWLIAQHSDHDVAFQKEALALMQAAGDGDIDTTELAYLEDRVAVNTGAPQIYGTQIRCGPGAEPVPATPIRDEEKVEQRRKKMKLQPLADYYDELRPICAQEAAENKD